MGDGRTLAQRRLGPADQAWSERPAAAGLARRQAAQYMGRRVRRRVQEHERGRALRPGNGQSSRSPSLEGRLRSWFRAHAAALGPACRPSCPVSGGQSCWYAQFTVGTGGPPTHRGVAVSPGLTAPSGPVPDVAAEATSKRRSPPCRRPVLRPARDRAWGGGSAGAESGPAERGPLFSASARPGPSDAGLSGGDRSRQAQRDRPSRQGSDTSPSDGRPRLRRAIGALRPEAGSRGPRCRRSWVVVCSVSS